MLSTVFDLTISELCPTSAPFFGFMGVAASIRQYVCCVVLVTP